MLSTILRYDHKDSWSTLTAKALEVLAVEPAPLWSNNIGSGIRFYPLTLLVTALSVVSAQEGRMATLKKIFELDIKSSNRHQLLLHALYKVESTFGRVAHARDVVADRPTAARVKEVLVPWLEPLLTDISPHYERGEFLISLSSLDVGVRMNGERWYPLGGLYLDTLGEAITRLLEERPRWLEDFYPDLRDRVSFFDDWAARNYKHKGNLGAGVHFRLLPSLPQQEGG